MNDNPERAPLLWKNFAATHSLEARNELVVHYLYLVKYIVYRMVPTYRRHVDVDDLMSCGLLGLMDAIDKFDIHKEVKFETYATLRIKGEIIDQIRKQDWAPISLRQKIKRVEDGFDAMEAKLGRTPSEQEVADFLAMKVEDLQKTLEDSHSFNVMSIDELLIDRVKGDEMFSSNDNAPENHFESEELARVLSGSIDHLTDREKLVISLYYYEEMTLKEIGLSLGVSESRVSQIHSKALISLRSHMKRAYA